VSNLVGSVGSADVMWVRAFAGEVLRGLPRLSGQRVVR
jgi:hypothetical protein